MRFFAPERRRTNETSLNSARSTPDAIIALLRSRRATSSAYLFRRTMTTILLVVAWFAGILIVVVVSPRLLAFIVNLFLRCIFILRAHFRGRSGGIIAATTSNARHADMEELSTDGPRPIGISSVTIHHISPWSFSLGGIVIRMSDGIMVVRVRLISLGVRWSLFSDNRSAGGFKPVLVLRVDGVQVSVPPVEREKSDINLQGSVDHDRSERTGVVVSLPRLAARWFHLVALEMNGLIIEEKGTQSSSPRQTRLTSINERREIRDDGVRVLRRLSLGGLSIHGGFSRRVSCLSVSLSVI